MADFDLIVIGGGPGGYVAAIRAAQLGKKVACVEKRKRLGGTCLNVGCIPSKALLESSHKFEDAKHHMKHHGVKVSGVELDLKAMMKRKDDAVEGLGGGIKMLFKKNKVEYIEGTGQIVKAGEVKVGSKSYSCENILIATGSDVMSLPGIDIDEKTIVSSTGALTLTSVPKHMVVIGGGVIGLEMGSVWGRLGSKVTVVEFLDRITPGMDGDICKEFKKVLESQGFEFMLGTKVLSAKKSGKSIKVEVEPASGGKKSTLDADVVLVSIGRKPYTEGLGLDRAGVKVNDRGFIEINDHFQTNVPGIWAIGDVVPGPMLAHKAEEEGIAAVELMAGHAGHVNYGAIPSVVYTHPEVACVGMTEEQVKEAGTECKVGKFPFMANSRARAVDSAVGFVKIVACKKTDKILGVHIIGPQAGDLIAEAVLAMEYGASCEDVARTCHAHPTLAEAFKEAALVAESKRAIHM